MDPLASSHTGYSPKGRRLLVMFFALILFRDSIVAAAGAPAYGNSQGVGSASEESLAQFRIRGEQAGLHDLLQRSGTERELSTELSSRRLLRDISPPGMWPTPDGHDPAPDTQEEFRRRSLLTGRTSPPPLGPWFDVVHSSQDGEDAFLRQPLIAENSYPLLPLALLINKIKQLGTVLTRTSLGFRIRLPGSSRENTAVTEDSLDHIERGDWHLRRDWERARERVVVPDAESSPDTVGNEMRSSTEHFEDSVAILQQAELAEELKLPRRSLLQGDISPPGMWSDSGDDESQLSESAQQSELAEELKFRRRSLLQGDISPPGMWSDSDDDERQLSESVMLRRRRLLNLQTALAEELKFPTRSLLQGDISPPGMWSDSDDDESQLSESVMVRRRLLSLQAELAEQLKFPTRSLLQGDISPPGMWSDSDDEDGLLSESLMLRRRRLLSLQAERAEELKFPTRSLLQGDISPPGMWPDADDDESQLSESVMLRRRRMLTL